MSDKSRFFQKNSTPQPTDLDHLAGWAERLELHLQKDNPSKHSWVIFRPDKASSDAMMVLSVNYRHVMDQLEDFLKHTEKCFETFSNEKNEVTKEKFSQAMHDLHGRIEAAVATISTSEDEKQADSKTDNKRKKQKIVPDNLDVIKLAKKINLELPQGGTKTDIAREFAGGNEGKAQNLLRELRRYPNLLN